MNLPQQSEFETLKNSFTKETGMNAKDNLELYIKYVQAKALIAINTNLGNLSASVQLIERKIKM